MKLKLIVGLGNLEAKYEKTRHNFGFRVLDSIVKHNDWEENKKLHAWIYKAGDVLYAKPTTFMNDSGLAVHALQQYFKIDLKDILIIFDDKDLPFGTIRYRTTGSSGGHNGIKSIIEHLTTTEFARLKLGVAPTDPALQIHDTADYVLARFSPEEEKALPEIIERVQQDLQLAPKSPKGDLPNL